MGVRVIYRNIESVKSDMVFLWVVESFYRDIEKDDTFCGGESLYRDIENDDTFCGGESFYRNIEIGDNFCDCESFYRDIENDDTFCGGESLYRNILIGDIFFFFFFFWGGGREEFLQRHRDRWHFVWMVGSFKKKYKSELDIIPGRIRAIHIVTIPRLQSKLNQTRASEALSADNILSLT